MGFGALAGVCWDLCSLLDLMVPLIYKWLLSGYCLMLISCSSCSVEGHSLFLLLQVPLFFCSLCIIPVALFPAQSIVLISCIACWLYFLQILEILPLCLKWTVFPLPEKNYLTPTQLSVLSWNATVSRKLPLSLHVDLGAFSYIHTVLKLILPWW